MNVKRSPLLCSNHAWATSGKDSYSCIKEIVQQQWAEMLGAMSICKNVANYQYWQICGGEPQNHEHNDGF